MRLIKNSSICFSSWFSQMIQQQQRINKRTRTYGFLWCLARTCTRNQSIFHLNFLWHALEISWQTLSLYWFWNRCCMIAIRHLSIDFCAIHFHSIDAHRIFIADFRICSLMIVRRYEFPLNGQMVVMMMMRMRRGRWIGGELIWTIRFIWRCSRQNFRHKSDVGDGQTQCFDAR